MVSNYETQMTSRHRLTCTCSNLTGWWCRWHSFFQICFFGGVFNLLLWLTQEFDNADGEDCSGGSSPIQEDSLSSCPSLPEVYTLPVRDRPDCPDLKNGAGTEQILSFQISSLQLMQSPNLRSSVWAADVDSVLTRLLNFSGVELWWEGMVHLCWDQDKLFLFCLLVNVRI